MRRLLLVVLVGAAACGLWLAPKWTDAPSPQPPVPPDAGAHRIVSLAPSLTEVLFSLGVGDRVCGVTDRCRYPAAAAAKPKVGGFLDAGAEAIAALEPDLVLAPPTSGDLPELLRQAGLRCVTVEQFTVSDIRRSLLDVGDLCGVPEAARQQVDELDRRLSAVKARTQGLPKPRVLVSVGRDYGLPDIDQVYVAGRQSFYGELVDLAGGENAYQGDGFAYPTLSAEGVMSLDPDVIVEVMPEREADGIAPEAATAAWSSLPTLAAVKAGRVHILDADYIGIPGPRVTRVVEDLAALLHPEAAA